MFLWELSKRPRDIPVSAPIIDAPIQREIPGLVRILDYTSEPSLIQENFLEVCKVGISKQKIMDPATDSKFPVSPEDFSEAFPELYRFSKFALTALKTLEVSAGAIGFPESKIADQIAVDFSNCHIGVARFGGEPARLVFTSGEIELSRKSNMYLNAADYRNRVLVDVINLLATYQGGQVSAL